MKYDVCAADEDGNYLTTLIPDNESMDEAIDNFIKECMKRVREPRELLSKLKFCVIPHDGDNGAMMLWAENENQENPVLLVMRQDRNVTMVYNTDGNLVGRDQL
jgi:hypothetical protein